MGQTSATQKLSDKFDEMKALPAGTVFSVTITDTELTDAASEQLSLHADEVAAMIKKYANMDLSVSDPKVSFRSDGSVELSAKAGLGFIKVTVSAKAIITVQDGKPIIQTQSVSLPVVKVDAAQVDGTVQPYINKLFETLQNQFVLQSLDITEGQAVIQAERK